MRKTVIALSVTAVLLSGCVPVVLMGAGTATGTALGRDSRSLQTISDDVDIQYQANQKLHNDSMTATGTNITVTSFNHVVLLVGQVPSDAVRMRAEADVQAVPKVRRVYNLLKVAPLEGIIQLGDDSRIATNIKARMTFTSGLNSDDFKVVVEDKVVYLMGYTTREQAERALDVIRNSSGVSRVVNLVEYKTQDAAANATVSTSSPASDTATTSAPEAAKKTTVGSVPEPLSMQPVSSKTIASTN